MDSLKKLLKVREMTSLLFIVVLFGGVGMINPSFLSPTSLLNSLNDSVVFTLLACGIAFVIFTGEIDVSIGATLGLAAAVSSTLLRDGSHWVVAMLAGILVGLVIGLFNGWGVAVLGIPSLIFTLGTNGLVRGLIYVYTGGAWVENLPVSFTKLSQAKIFSDLSWFYFITFLAVLGLHFVLTKTRRGKYVIAVGDNMQGSTLVGIPAVQVKVLMYVLCAVVAAIAGIVYSSRIGFITATAGNGYEMKAIAACVLGGISLTGGVGSLMGAAIGAIIMSSVGRILVFLGLSSDYDNTITGVLLIFIVVSDAMLQRRVAEKNRRERLSARTGNEEGGVA